MDFSNHPIIFLLKQLFVMVLLAVVAIFVYPYILNSTSLSILSNASFLTFLFLKLFHQKLLLWHFLSLPYNDLDKEFDYNTSNQTSEELAKDYLNSLDDFLNPGQYIKR